MTTGEFELIAQIAPYLDAPVDVLAGQGDDAAIVRIGDQPVCLTTDVLVEGRHFRTDLSSPEDIGWKAVAVNCSDLAAMGAVPSAAVVGLTRPARCDPEHTIGLYRGMREAADRWSVALVGGDTTAGEQLVLSLAMVGHTEGRPPVLRSGASPGDRLILAGTLGAAATALAQVRHGRQPSADLLAAHRRPQAQVEAGRGLAEAGVTAMIDISDGLGADLAHVCRASHVAARMQWRHLPVAPGVREASEGLGADPVALVCGGGEDFALLAAIGPERVADALAAVRPFTSAREIGVLEAVDSDQPLVALDIGAGRVRELADLGYDHYRSSG